MKNDLNKSWNKEDFDEMVVHCFKSYRQESIGFILKKYQFSEAEAQDIYQSIWEWILSKAKNVPDLREKKNKPWFWHYLNWRCLNRIRGEKRYYKRIENWLDLDDPLSRFTDDKDGTIESSVEFAIAFEILNTVKKNLGNECRSLFTLYYQDNYSTEEIGKMKGMATQTIRNKMHDCRNKVKKILTRS